jgi:V8-like Glu-specific endopeptidase
MKFKTLAFLAIIFLIVTITLSPVGLAQVSADTDDGTMSSVMTRAQQRNAVKFWTREAIASAQPMEMPVDMSAPVVASSAAMPEQAVGAFGWSPAGAAAPGAEAVAKQHYWNDWKASAQPALEVEADEPAGTSATFDSYVINSWNLMGKMPPHQFVGRLSFTTTGGTSYCSATAISSNNIVTAAHCVYDTVNNVWYSNWAFSPAYSDGKTPYGTFPTTVCTIMTAYQNYSGSYSISGWAPMDVAVCSVGTNTALQTLNNAVGWAGRQWNYGSVRHYFNMGYPFKDTNGANLQGAGKFQRTCVAESFSAYTDVLGMGCDLANGISGGPWMTSYKMGVYSGYVNGVNSGFFMSTANMYAGRFTDGNIVQLCNARGC